MTFLSFPIDDWQFWVASAVALGALVVLVKPLFASKRQSGCSNCPTGKEMPPQS